MYVTTVSSLGCTGAESTGWLMCVSVPFVRLCVTDACLFGNLERARYRCDNVHLCKMGNDCSSI